LRGRHAGEGAVDEAIELGRVERASAGLSGAHEVRGGGLLECAGAAAREVRA
jgi:hypothetical protein